jgi:hypothetical protein
MIDTTKLVAAIKRARRGQEGKKLHLLVPTAVSAELVAVLAQLDVKVVVAPLLTAEHSYLVDAEDKKFWYMEPEPLPTFAVSLVDLYKPGWKP